VDVEAYRAKYIPYMVSYTGQFRKLFARFSQSVGGDVKRMWNPSLRAMILSDMSVNLNKYFARAMCPVIFLVVVVTAGPKVSCNPR